MLIPSLMPEGEKEKEWGLETKYGRKGGGGEREKRVRTDAWSKVLASGNMELTDRQIGLARSYIPF